MLENRIKRLAFEASRAQKVTDTVTIKAEKLLEARERHQKENEEKMEMKVRRKMEKGIEKVKNYVRKTGIIQRAVQLFIWFGTPHTIIAN